MATTDQGTLSIPAPGMNPVNTSAWADTSTPTAPVTSPTLPPPVYAQTYATDYTVTPKGYTVLNGNTPSFATPTGQPVSITAESLATTNPINVPATGNTASNAAQSVIGGSTAETNTLKSITDEQALKAEEAKKAYETASKNPTLNNALGVFGNKAGLTATEESKVPALEPSKELARNLTQEYTTKQLAFNQVMASIYNNPSISGALKADQLDNLSRQHAFDLTDLSIRQNIAVGNYQALQDSVDKRINLLYGDAKDQVDYFTAIKNDAKLDWTKAEEKTLDLRIKQAEDKKKEGDDLKNTINKLTLSAVSQNAPADVVAKIAKATTENEAIQAAGQYSVDQLDRDVKKSALLTDQLQREKLRADIEETLAKTAANSPAAVEAKKKGEMLDTVNLIDGIIKDPYLPNVTGIKTPGAWFGGFFGSMVGSPTIPVINKLKQVRAILSLENRQKLKGSGAISDFESKTLENASSAFSTGLSNAAAVKELTKIKGAMSTAAGLSATVEIKDPVSGDSDVRMMTRDDINNAIADGLIVEYK